MVDGKIVQLTDRKEVMDKPRWLLTWSLAVIAADVTRDLSFWAWLGCTTPFILAAYIIENYRSWIQNGEPD